MILRELSPFELYFFYRCHTQLHSCFYHSITLNKLPTRDQLLLTLKKLLQIHPELHQNIILGESKKPYLNDITDYPIFLKDIVEYKESWTELGEAETNYIFQTHYFDFTQETKPLWRILVLPQSNQLVLLLSHALYDGMSSVRIWSSFMSALQEVAKTNTESTTTDLDSIIYQSASPTSEEELSGVASVKFHPYSEWRVPLAWKIKRYIVALLFKVSPEKIVVKPNQKLLQFKNYKFPQGLLLHKEEKSGGEDYFHQRYRVRNDNVQRVLYLTTSQLSSVKQQCKSHKVSLTSYIVSLFMLSLRSVINKEGVTCTGSVVKVEIPMDTRSECEARVPSISPGELQLGNFIAGIEYSEDISKYSFPQREEEEDDAIWQIARSVQTEIRESRSTKLDEIINNVKLLEVVDNVGHFIQQKIEAGNGTGPSGTFEVTNLGLVDYAGNCSESLQFYVKDARWNEPQGFSNIFTCCVLSTPLGGLSCSISVPRDIGTQFDPVLESVQTLLKGGICV